MAAKKEAQEQTIANNEATSYNPYQPRCVAPLIRGRERTFHIHDASKPSTTGPNPPNITLETHKAACSALTSILNILTTPNTDSSSHRPGHSLRSHVTNVTIRTFTPNACGYGTTLEFDSHPAFKIMQDIAEGVFDTWCWRGKGGTGWIVRVRGNRPNNDGRWVSNSWPAWVGDEKED